MHIGEGGVTNQLVRSTQHMSLQTGKTDEIIASAGSESQTERENTKPMSVHQFCHYRHEIGFHD